MYPRLFFSSLVFILFFSTVIVKAQKHPSMICFFRANTDTSLPKFSSTKSLKTDKYGVFVLNIVNKILSTLKEDMNFIPLYSDSVGSKHVAAAYIDKGVRYILYDYPTLEKMDTGLTDWSSTCVIAHEIAHHILGHTRDSNIKLSPSENIHRERNADEWAGRILYALGATPTQIKEVFTAHEKERNDATIKGYNNAKNKVPVIKEYYIPKATLAFCHGYEESLNNQTDNALREYSEAIKLNPKLFQAYTARGKIMAVNFKDYNAALNDFSKAIDIDPLDECAYVQKGYAMAAWMNKPDSAISECNKVIKFSPDYAYAYYLRGYAKSMKGIYSQEIIDDFSKPIKMRESLYDSYRGRATQYYNLERYEEAEQDFTDALEISTSLEYVRYYRGVCRYNIQDFEGAFQDFDFIYKSPNDFKELVMYRGRTRLALELGSLKLADIKKITSGNKITPGISAALVDLEAAYNSDPSNISFILPYGHAKILVGDRREGLRLIEKAIQLYPSNAEAYFYRAIANVYFKKDIKARADFRKACELGYAEACGLDRISNY